MFEKSGGHGKMSMSRITDSVVSLWIRSYTYLFFVAFFGVCAWGAFLWYYSLYRFQWSPEQKRTYTESQSHRTVLNKNDFDQVLGTLDHRENIYRSDPVPVKNIFMTDPPPPK